jgi:putative transcriptional regulator
MITHHPSDAGLAQFAAGTLGAGPRIVMATHLSGCPQCRGRLRAFEAVGGALLDETAPAELRPEAFARTLARLDAPIAPVKQPILLHPELPAPLRHCDIGSWRFVQPGLRWRRVVLPDAPDANVIMLKVCAGGRVPEHGHAGTEFTQVLTGGFSDRFGRYRAGDCIEMDEEAEHQPVVDLDGECIVLAAVEGRLRLNSWIGRLFQPLIGI